MDDGGSHFFWTVGCYEDCCVGFLRRRGRVGIHYSDPWPGTARELLELQKFSRPWHVGLRYTKDRLAITAQQRAGLRICNVAAALFANTVLIRVLPQCMSVKLQVMLSCIVGIVSHVLYMTASSALAVYPANIVGALGALIGVYVNTLMANVAVTSGLPVGAVMGVFASVSQVGILFGPPIFSSVFIFSMKDVFWGHSFPQLAFCLGLLINLVNLQLLLGIPEAAYEGKKPIPSEVAQDPHDPSSP